MQDYLLKMIADHPLLTFLEDPLATEKDIANLKKFKQVLSEKYNYVQMSLKNIFADCSIDKIVNATQFEDWTDEDFEKESIWQ